MSKPKLNWNKEFAEKWGRYPAPVRPGLEMKIYEEEVSKALDGIKEPQVLIMGCTAEFRDMLLKMKLVPNCLDINPDLFEALKYLMKEEGREKFIKGNWLEYDSASKYDLIIGHAIINMLPHAKQEALIRKVSNNLKQGGIFLNTVTLRPDSKDNIPLDRGFKNYRRSGIADKDLLFMYSYPDMMLSYGQKHGSYTPNISRKRLKWMLARKLIKKSEYEQMLHIISESELKIDLVGKKQLEKVFEEYFSSIKSLYKEQILRSQILANLYIEKIIWL